jgi:hypothetical protein
VPTRGGATAFVRSAGRNTEARGRKLLRPSTSNRSTQAPKRSVFGFFGIGSDRSPPAARQATTRSASHARLRYAPRPRPRGGRHIKGPKRCRAMCIQNRARGKCARPQQIGGCRATRESGDARRLRACSRSAVRRATLGARPNRGPIERRAAPHPSLAVGAPARLVGRSKPRAPRECDA